MGKGWSLTSLKQWRVNHTWFPIYPRQMLDYYFQIDHILLYPCTCRITLNSTNTLSCYWSLNNCWIWFSIVFTNHKTCNDKLLRYFFVFLISGSENVLLNPSEVGGFMGWEGGAWWLHSVYIQEHSSCMLYGTPQVHIWPLWCSDIAGISRECHVPEGYSTETRELCIKCTLNYICEKNVHLKSDLKSQ
jgi:hypothetical protein